MSAPRLYIVIPCYNEQEVLPLTAPLFLEKIRSLSGSSSVAHSSVKRNSEDYRVNVFNIFFGFIETEPGLGGFCMVVLEIHWSLLWFFALFFLQI